MTLKRASFTLRVALLMALPAAPSCGGDGASTQGGADSTSTPSTGGTASGGGGSGGASGGGGGAGAGGGAGGGAGAVNGGGGAGGCIPEEDGEACTDDVCTPDGTTAHPPKPAGEPCGGGICDGAGQCVGCLADADCTAPQICHEDAARCVDPTCDDGEKDGDETDVDCGGSCPQPCADGQGCSGGDDCASGVCGARFACLAPACGDSVLHSGETCDDGNLADGDGCDSNCTPTNCGNGVVTAGEGCDDGNLTNADGCDSNCTPTGCGNGLVSPGEECDDGNGIDGDGCNNDCTLTICGDGVQTPYEACDDGNQVNGDGCDQNCTPTACGNGVVSGAEECDDANTAGGDGCTAGCQVEPHYTCTRTAVPGFCIKHESACNDGIDNDGNGQIDGADIACKLPLHLPPCGAGQALHVYRPLGLPKNLPDGDPAGIVTGVYATLGGTVQKVALILAIGHSNDADVDVLLTPPGGPQLDVCTDNGGSGDHFNDTVLDSTCATSITAGTAPLHGCFKPETPFTPLNGTPAAGLWELVIADDAPMSMGFVNGWTLVLCTAP